MIAMLLAAAAVATSLFAQAFAGSWTCTGGYHWHIVPAPGVGWTTVQWGPRTADGGTAYVGFVPKLKEWIYYDFHGDGTFATNTSPGPASNGWTWTGTYYQPNAEGNGSVLWRRSSASRIDRTFNFTMNGKAQTAHDSCTKN
jgi:hypothetical protein